MINRGNKFLVDFHFCKLIPENPQARLARSSRSFSCHDRKRLDLLSRESVPLRRILRYSRATTLLFLYACSRVLARVCCPRTGVIVRAAVRDRVVQHYRRATEMAKGPARNSDRIRRIRRAIGGLQVVPGTDN